MSNEFLIQALVYIGASMVLVPIAKKIGLSSIVGYLIAGIIIGPFVLQLAGDNGEDIMHASEFGVVLMLFLIGLELDPQKFWEMRKAIVGLGTAQMLVTGFILYIALFFFVPTWQSAVTIALAFAMSSTAIVLQTLKEKGFSKMVSGQSSFAVLLFQDIAIIPILAILPFLGTKMVVGEGDHSGSFIDDQSGGMQVLMILAAVGVILVTGRYMIVPFLRYISKTGLRELFTASSIFLVVGVAALMQTVGLSPALGTFLAGVVLANSEFRHELESDIEPFKGMLLGLFFVSVGVTIDFNQVFNAPGIISLLVAIVLVVKFAVLFGIGKVFKMDSDQNFIFSFGLSQAGEFAFVLLGFATQLGILDNQLSSTMMAVVALTMVSTPFLLLINERIIDPYFGIKKVPTEDESDEINEKNKVIIAGFGHFGSTVGRLLRANKVEATILDHDSDRVALLRKMGFKVYYGDATRHDLLHAAGASEAHVLIAAIDSPEINHRLIETVKKHFPNIKVFSRARNRYDAYELMDLGIANIYRETLYTAAHLGADVLSSLGFRKYTAIRQSLKFINYDEKSLENLAKKRNNLTEYILTVKEEIEWQEQLLQNDLAEAFSDDDHAWDGQYMRDEIGKG